MNCYVLKKGNCIITQGYKSTHKAIDLVGTNRTLDKIVAHSSGKVIEVQDGYNNNKNSSGLASYGNYIKIDHQNGFITLYAHLEKGLTLKKGDYVNKGDILGTMSDSGKAYGKHLHFEVLKNGTKIDPSKYLNAPFEQIQENIVVKETNINLNYKIGDTVTIKSVYKSSTSLEALNPSIKEGTITKLVENSRNPYLLDNGNIGWINEDSIVKENVIKEKVLSNKNYKGSSIVDALKEIKVDSSYSYRAKIAKLNNINNYKGTAKQNIELLNLLKNGKLKY